MDTGVFKGWRTLAFGLLMVLGPPAASYLGNIDWASAGLPPWAVMVAGLIVMGLRVITNTPVGRMIVTLAPALGLAAALSACSMFPPFPGDAATAEKIRYVCAYSGLFEFADSTAKIIPVPGVSLGIDAINLGVDKTCQNPDAVGGGVDAVKDLIARFKSLGKM